MSRRPVTDRPRHVALLHSLGTGLPLRFQPSGPTFHLLTEAGDALLTEAGDHLDLEHV